MFALFEDASFVSGGPQVLSLRSVTSGYEYSPPLATAATMLDAATFTDYIACDNKYLFVHFLSVLPIKPIICQ